MCPAVLLETLENLKTQQIHQKTRGSVCVALNQTTAGSSRLLTQRVRGPWTHVQEINMNVFVCLWEAPAFDVCLWDLLTIREIKAKAQRSGGRTCNMSLTWIQSVTEQFRDVSAGAADYCNYSFCSAVLGA